jgi:hypothetical protein
MGQQTGGFVFGKDGRQVLRFFGSDGVNGIKDGQVKDFTVEKEDGRERLVLGRSSDMEVNGEVGAEEFIRR